MGKKSPGDSKKSGSPRKKSPKKSPTKVLPPQTPEPPEVKVVREPEVLLEAPRGPGAMYIKRQPWYPHVRNPDLRWKEYSWGPVCPLITSWGDVWVSDRGKRRIWRYRMGACLGGWWEKRGMSGGEVEARPINIPAPGSPEPRADTPDTVQSSPGKKKKSPPKSLKSSPKTKKSPKSAKSPKGSPKVTNPQEIPKGPPLAMSGPFKTMVPGLQRLPTLLIRGEPSIIIETPGTGRILAIVNCPAIHCSILTQYSPNGDVENVRRYPYECFRSSLDTTAMLNESKKVSPKKVSPKKVSPKKVSPKKVSPKKSSKKGSPGSKKSSPKASSPPPKPNPSSIDASLFMLDLGRPIGITIVSDILFVLRSSLQAIELLHPRKLFPIDFRLQGGSRTEGSCVHLTTSGGCAGSEGFLYVALTRPPRILVFQIIKEMCLSIIDRVTIRALYEFGMDRMKQPCCLRVDSLGVLAVSDSQWGYLRAYHKYGAETSCFGGWKVDCLRVVRPGHFSISKNGITCLVDVHTNELLFYVDKIVLKWYRDTLYYMEDLAWLKHIVDEELTPYPPTRRAEPDAYLKGFDIVRWPFYDPDGIWPRPPKNILKDEIKENVSPTKKTKKSKKSPPSKSSSKKNKKRK